MITINYYKISGQKNYNKDQSPAGTFIIISSPKILINTGGDLVCNLGTPFSDPSTASGS